jgi:hypothetical protein
MESTIERTLSTVNGRRVRRHRLLRGFSLLLAQCDTGESSGGPLAILFIFQNHVNDMAGCRNGLVAR